MVLGHTCCRFPRRPGPGSRGAYSAAVSTSVQWSLAHVGSRPGVQVSEAYLATPLLQAPSNLSRLAVVSGAASRAHCPATWLPCPSLCS
eukprot:9482901-Pyramimonas_sp.AAC.1